MREHTNRDTSRPIASASIHRVARRRGFTLVELLVVVAIIALLLGILLPALGRARQIAEQVVCGANVKQIMSASLMYAGDNNGQLPPWVVDLKTPRPDFPFDDPLWDSDTTEIRWAERLIGLGYLGSGGTEDNPSSSVLTCPGSDVIHDGADGDVETWRHGNYAINESMTSMWAPPSRRNMTMPEDAVNIHGLSRPAERLAFVDGGVYRINWYWAGVQPGLGVSGSADFYLPGSPINEEFVGSWSPNVEHDAVIGRHAGANVSAGFLDSHVETTGAKDLVQRILDTSGRRKEQYVMWLPDAE